MYVHPGDALSREERERIINESLMETRAQGMEPSERSKQLAQQWVNGEITFPDAAAGIYEEAMKERKAKRHGQ